MQAITVSMKERILRIVSVDLERGISTWSRASKNILVPGNIPTLIGQLTSTTLAYLL